MERYGGIINFDAKTFKVGYWVITKNDDIKDYYITVQLEKESEISEIMTDFLNGKNQVKFTLTSKLQNNHYGVGEIVGLWDDGIEITNLISYWEENSDYEDDTDNNGLGDLVGSNSEVKSEQLLKEFEFDVPDYISKNEELYESERYKKFVNIYKERPSRFEALGMEEIRIIAGFYSARSLVDLEENIGTEELISLMIDTVLKQEGELNLNYDEIDNIKSQEDPEEENVSYGYNFDDSLFTFNTPELILNNPDEYDPERYKKFMSNFAKNPKRFKDFSPDNTFMIATFYALRVGEAIEEEMGTDNFIDYLIEKGKEFDYNNELDKNDELKETFEDYIEFGVVSAKVEDLGIAPDYSYESLNRLGEYLAQVDPEAMSIESRNQLVLVAAAYFGEIIKRNSGNAYRWITYDKAISEGLINKEQDYFNTFFMVEKSGNIIYPLSNIYKVIEGHDEPSHLSFLADFLCMNHRKMIMNISLDDVNSIIFRGSTFVLTGDFSYGSKEKVQNFIETKGGYCRKSISGKTDYLVVGSLGSPAWTYGQEGGVKVKEAREEKNKGSNIKIISEDSLFKGDSSESRPKINDKHLITPTINSELHLTKDDIIKKYERGYCRLIGYTAYSSAENASIRNNIGGFAKVKIMPTSFTLSFENGVIATENPVKYGDTVYNGWGFPKFPTSYDFAKQWNAFEYNKNGSRFVIVFDGLEKDNEIRGKQILDYQRIASTSSCFVATAVYKDPMCYQLIVLRKWRDEVLANIIIGRIFINLYYKHGMKLAKIVEKSDTLSLITKWQLDFLIERISKKLSRKNNQY